MNNGNNDLEGYFLDRDNFLYRNATVDERNRFVSEFGNKLRNKTELVNSTALKLEDETFLIHDHGGKRSGLWFHAEIPLVDAYMTNCYNGLEAAYIKKSQKNPQVWEFADDLESCTHVLIRSKWNGPETKDTEEGKMMNLKPVYMANRLSKAQKSGHIWAVIEKENLNEELFM